MAEVGSGRAVQVLDDAAAVNLQGVEEFGLWDAEGILVEGMTSSQEHDAELYRIVY